MFNQLKFNRNSKIINDKINKYAPNLQTYFTSLEEEHELELEKDREIEEEKEVKRPGLATPCENSLEDDVLKLVKYGIFNSLSSCFLSISKSLEESSLKNLIQPNAWSKSIFTTRDFFNTVETENEIDCYLRSPKWIRVFKVQKNNISTKHEFQQIKWI